MTQRFPPTNPDERIYQRIKSLEQRLDLLERKNIPTLPLYDAGNFPQDPVEQQIVIAYGQPNATIIAELGYEGVLGGSTQTTRTHTIQFNDIVAGDGIFVLTAAPIQPGASGPTYLCTGVTDSVGNTYTLLDTMDWGPSTPAQNTGANVKLWWCANATAGLTKNVDTITATWGGAVYANFLKTWVVKRAGGLTATLLAKTPDHDTTSYATDYVDSPSFTWTPSNPRAQVFAMFLLMRSTNTSVATMYAYGGHGSDTKHSIMRVGAASASGVPNAFGYDLHADLGSGAVTHVVTDTPDWYFATGETDVGEIVTGAPWYVGQNYSTGPPLAAGGGVNKWKGVFQVGFD